MLVSTKGRYALRVMLDLAEHNTGENIKLVDISKRQEISEKYLESIAKVLSKKGLIYAQRGKGGGYKLNYSPENYTVLQILDAVEEDTAPIECLGKCSITCKRMPFCKTYPMWKGLNQVVKDYLNKITLLDLVTGNSDWSNYSI